MSLAPAFTHHESPMIFNHDIMSCTADGVSGNYLYSGRALGLTDVDDVIQLHPALKGQWFGISAHYQQVGLPHASKVIWDVSPERLDDYPSLNESLFFFGYREHRVRPHYDFHRVVEHINSKNNFIALASHLRLDVPQTLCFSGKQWFAGINNFPYPCYLKAAVSVSGKGIYRCKSPADLIKALAHFDEDVPLQVQEELDTSLFLNVQYRGTDYGLERLLITEQVLKGFSHQGNRYPASHEPWESVDPMAEWLVEKGLRDVFAFDVAVLEDGNQIRYVPIECNPRYNGASYPSGVAVKLGLNQWIAKDFETRHSLISQIDLSDIEYKSTTGRGVIIINWGTVMVGKIGVLLVGDLEEQERLEEVLLSRL